MAFQEVVTSFTRFDWFRLMSKKCPKCSGGKVLSPRKGIMSCTNKRCKYQITEERMIQITDSIEDENHEEVDICGGCGKPDPICSCYG